MSQSETDGDERKDSETGNGPSHLHSSGSGLLAPTMPSSSNVSTANDSF